jgi:hypothetical protein
MKQYLKPVFCVAVIAFLAATSAQASGEEKVIIALMTDDFELSETDISNLGVGESQTIETESGKIVDLVRTADGVEVYVDGELLDMDIESGGMHQKHHFSKKIEVICADGDECEKNVFIMAADGDHDIDWEAHEVGNIVMHKSIELSCSSDDEDTECSDNMVWISDGDEMDLEELHEIHSEDGNHKIIVIKKDIDTDQ